MARLRLRLCDGVGRSLFLARRARGRHPRLSRSRCGSSILNRMKAVVVCTCILICSGLPTGSAVCCFIEVRLVCVCVCACVCVCVLVVLLLFSVAVFVLGRLRIIIVLGVQKSV